MTILELTRKLVNIPSLTGDESEIGSFLFSYLQPQGFAVCKQEIPWKPLGVEQARAREGKRCNIFAALGDPKIIFTTHLDTVPPYIPFREDTEHLYGRGVCDAKGIIASMIKAGEKLMQEDIRDFGYLFTVGEETDSVGAKAAINLNLKADYLIVGEPTDNKLALGHKGNLTFSLETYGVAAHSAHPEQGESAIEKLLDVIRDLKKINLDTDELLGKSTLNIGLLQGGTNPNVIPDHATAKIMLRIVAPAEAVEEQVRAVIKDRAKFEIISKVDPQKMIKINGFQTTVVSFGTDIPYLRQLGEPLLIGPGSILDAHSANEKISKREIYEAVGIYSTLARTLASLSSS